MRLLAAVTSGRRAHLNATLGTGCRASAGSLPSSGNWWFGGFTESTLINDARRSCHAHKNRITLAYFAHGPRHRDTAMEDEGITPAEARDDELDEHLDTQVPALKSLWDRLLENYDVAAWGLREFAGISNEEQRAIASDLVLSAVEGAHVNLRELAMSAADVARYSGPNGTTMPGPETTLDDYLDAKRLHRAITETFRALGSTLDCLAALTIGILGLPNSLQAAAGSVLLNFPELGWEAPRSQHEARERVQAGFEAIAEDPAGWLAWGLELRDAVVHRGHLTQIMLTRPAGVGPQFIVRTDTPFQYLVRMEPHLRGRPWQPDMLSLSAQGSIAGAMVWLPEPAAQTTAEVKVRTVNLVRAISELLREALDADRSGWLLPEKQWRLERAPARTKPRTARAMRFSGFDPTYPVPPLSQIRVHHKSVPRLQLAERLRTTKGVFAADEPENSGAEDGEDDAGVA